LSEVEARKTLVETFAKAINELTISDVGTTRVISSIKVSDTKPSVVKNQEFVLSSKTIFNRVIGDSGLELRFADFLDKALDVESFAKNILAVNFKIEYMNSKGELANYYPDFLVKINPSLLYIVETKGLEDSETSKKWRRLVSWCSDATETDLNQRKFVPLYVSERDFDDYAEKSGTFLRFADLLRNSEPVAGA
jgi:type III restriction enzyme